MEFLFALDWQSLKANGVKIIQCATNTCIFFGGTTSQTTGHCFDLVTFYSHHAFEIKVKGYGIFQDWAPYNDAAMDPSRRPTNRNVLEHTAAFPWDAGSRGHEIRLSSLKCQGCIPGETVVQEKKRGEGKKNHPLSKITEHIHQGIFGEHSALNHIASPGLQTGHEKEAFSILDPLLQDFAEEPRHLYLIALSVLINDIFSSTFLH